MSEKEKAVAAKMSEVFTKLPSEQQEAIMTIAVSNLQVNEIIARQNEQKAAEPQAAQSAAL